MSTELVSRIWFAQPASPTTKLWRLLEALEQRAAGLSAWRGLTVRSSDLATKLLHLPGPLSLEQVGRALGEYAGEGIHLSVRASLQCWRFQGSTASAGFVPIYLESWGQEFIGNHGRRREIEGDASFAIADSGPFIALLDADNGQQVAAINRYVEENLERVTELILTVAALPSTWALKSFTAQGLYQPLNTHLVFFRDPQVLIDDLRFIKELWFTGLTGYRTGPLRHSVEQLDRYALHPWRSAEQSHALALRVSSLIERVDRVDAAVLARFDWARFDTLDGDTGRAVLDYPHWLNSFLDRLYIELLELA